MKTTFAAALLLATSAIAAPASFLKKRQCDTSTEPSVQALGDAIKAWNVDVEAVNAFLENPPLGAGLAAATQDLLINRANNEPVQLGIMSGVCEVGGAYDEGVATLKAEFPNVPSALQNIIDNPTDANAHAQIATINHVRCCFVLPSLDSLWGLGAADYGIANQVPLSAPRPSACSFISC